MPCASTRDRARRCRPGDPHCIATVPAKGLQTHTRTEKRTHIKLDERHQMARTVGPPRPHHPGCFGYQAAHMAWSQVHRTTTMRCTRMKSQHICRPRVHSTVRNEAVRGRETCRWPISRRLTLAKREDHSGIADPGLSTSLPIKNRTETARHTTIQSYLTQSANHCLLIGVRLCYDATTHSTIGVLPTRCREPSSQARHTPVPAQKSRPRRPRA